MATILPSSFSSIISRAIGQIPESASLLLKSLDGDRQQSYFTVTQVSDDASKLVIFAYRVLRSTTVPKGYTLNSNAKSNRQNEICCHQTTQRWESLFAIIHSEMKLPFTSNVDSFVSKYKRINSRKKNRSHPFGRAWDNLVKSKNIFHGICKVIMDGTSMWRKTSETTRQCENKLAAYNLSSLIRPDVQIKTISVLWDITCLLRWIILMVKCKRVDRQPLDFDPPVQIPITPTCNPISLSLSAEDQQWLNDSNIGEDWIIKWFSYSIEFCVSIGEDRNALLDAKFFPLTIYLTNIVSELRKHFYRRLQRVTQNVEELKQLAKITNTLKRKCKNFPITAVNIPMISSIRGLLQNQLIQKWIKCQVDNINPLIIAPPQTWSRLLQFTKVPHVDLSTVDKDTLIYQICRLIYFARQLSEQRIIPSYVDNKSL